MLEIYVDAATAGNPGKSGIGIVIKGEGHHVTYSEAIGEMDNHLAEFTALEHALQKAMTVSTGFISVRSDSKAVVAAVEKQFAKHEPYKSALERILQLSTHFEFFFIKWIPEKENKEADQLARLALQKNR